MRRVVEFQLDDTTLFGTVDDGDSASGLLIVSGGNEIRIGAHRGMAVLAQEVAANGHPVFRFDRRGIGDSEGENVGFAGSADDIEAALAAFKTASPALTRVVAFGNCDAATALVLYGTTVDGLVLANPWIVEQFDDLPAPAAIKKRYVRRLRDPKSWVALVTGKLNLRATIRGLRRLVAGTVKNEGLRASVAARLASSTVPVTIIVADGDNTGIVFADAWQSSEFEAARSRRDVDFVTLTSSSHSFANEADFAFLLGRLIKVLRQ